MEGIKIYKRPKLKEPYLIVAWPGMGEVAFQAATYLAEKLPAEEFAQLQDEAYFYFSGSEVRNGILALPELPYNKFYYWKNKSGKNDLILFISNAQPDLSRAQEYSKKIIELAKGFQAKAVIGFAAMLQPIEHTEEPQVWSCATSEALREQLEKYNTLNLSEGQISGMNGLFLGLAKKEGLDGLCLSGEIPLYTIQIKNPRASQAVLEVLCRILNIKVDFAGLSQDAQVIEGEINKLMDTLRLGSQAQGPIGEEEIERIKKALGQFTKLPVSVKEKIEKLFAGAKEDITKAKELKTELDKWHAYKDYEDRFLDLFKKQKDKGN